MRIGFGYDVHRLCKGRDLIIGGVKIPCDKGLLGHSDADVLIHAIIDAILGALALGDIGKHYPDNDQKYKNINSRILLKETAAKIDSAGYVIGNIDTTICAQEPKLSPYIAGMRANISQDLNTGRENVSVKATTEEKLGFTGEGRGVSVYAVVLLFRKK